MGRFRAGATFTIAALGAIACNALTGVGDLEVGLATSDAGPDAARIDSGGGPIDSGGNIPTDSGLVDSPSGALTCGDASGRCVPATPDGWNGPFVELDSDVNGNLADCPGAAPNNVDLAAGAPQSTFTCGACRCGNLTGVTCSATLNTYSDTACDATLGSSDPTMCQPNNQGADGSFMIIPEASGGSCTPQVQGQPQVGDTTWTGGMKRFCGSDNFNAIGCATADQRCLPSAAGAHFCIVNDGDLACPAEWPVKSSTYADVDDSRSCSPSSCSCDDPTGVTCSGTYHTYTSSTCAVGTTNFLQNVKANTCTNFTAGYGVKVSNLGVNGGTCAPHGAPTPQGQLVAKADTLATMCCLP